MGLAAAGTAAPKVTPNTPRAAVTSVVELPWRAIRNGWGPVEKNRSNGEDHAGDGRPISMNKKRYRSGFGCHAASEIRVPLGVRYHTFICDIGFDDEVRWQKPAERKTRVVFLVYGDNQRLYSSNVVTANSPTKTIKVSVRGKKQLRLVVMRVGDGRLAHVDWASPRLLR